MNKLAKILQDMNYEELLLLKKDVDSGNLDKNLHKQIAARQAHKITLCPVCHSPVRQGEGYYLEFGSKDLRRKATFDAKDCLTYFLTNDGKKSK